VQDLWKRRGVLRISCRRPAQLKRLLRSKKFTAVIIAAVMGFDGKVLDRFLKFLKQDLLEFVQEGGIVAWNCCLSIIKTIFPMVKWTEGDDARGFGVFEPNRRAVEDIFGAHCKTRKIHDRDMCFYEKALTLMNVPREENYFSSAEARFKGTIVAVKNIGKGELAYFGHVNLDCAVEIIRTFVRKRAKTLRDMEYSSAAWWKEKEAEENSDSDMEADEGYEDSDSRNSEHRRPRTRSAGRRKRLR